MNFLSLKRLVALTACAALAAPPAATGGVIGSVIARSAIRIDDGSVKGNAALFAGNVVQTEGGTGELRLRNGGAVLLDSNARVRVFENRAEIEAGKAQFRGGIAAQSGNIRVETADGAEAIVERSAKSLVVGSLRGSVRVKGENGILLASLNSGNAMSFSAASPEEDQGGANPAPNPNNTAKKTNHNGARLKKAGWWVASGAAVAVPTVVMASRNNSAQASR